MSASEEKYDINTCSEPLLCINFATPTPHTTINVIRSYRGLSHLPSIEDCHLNNYHLPIVKIVILSFNIGVEMQRVTQSQVKLPILYDWSQRISQILLTIQARMVCIFWPHSPNLNITHIRLVFLSKKTNPCYVQCKYRCLIYMRHDIRPPYLCVIHQLTKFTLFETACSIHKRGHPVCFPMFWGTSKDMKISQKSTKTPFGQHPLTLPKN